MRRQAAYLTMTVAEHFRDDGKNVMCMMDSVTRFAMAQREIGLSIGEPPTSKGYTPTVFTELPKLLERAGPGRGGVGSITGLFTVLVEGDNHNEPVADAVRGRYPAINVLKSVSRTMPRCVPEAAVPVLRKAKALMATYSDMEELIRLGAYKRGSDALVDEAIRRHDPLETFLGQGKGEATSLSAGYLELANLLEMTLG
jgi:flagellum-specific ATP synthase